MPRGGVWMMRLLTVAVLVAGSAAAAGVLRAPARVGDTAMGECRAEETLAQTEAVRTGGVNQALVEGVFKWISGLDNATIAAGFQRFDYDRSGNITSKELRRMLHVLTPQLQPSDLDLMAMIDRVDLNHDGAVTLPEVLTAVRAQGDAAAETDLNKIQSVLNAVAALPDAALRTHYRNCDANHDGRITADEFGKGISSVPGFGLTPAEEKAIVNMVDLDADGLISLDEVMTVARSIPTAVAAVAPSAAAARAMGGTRKMWNFSLGKHVYYGPADNSLPKRMPSGSGPVHAVTVLDSTGLNDWTYWTQQNKYLLLYLHAPWCRYCESMPPVLDRVAGDLITGGRQPQLAILSINGDHETYLRKRYKVTAYPSLVLTSRDAGTILGRYRGPRQCFDIANWVTDLIVSDQNPVVKQIYDPEIDQFSGTKTKEFHTDLYPVYPYSGESAYTAVPPPPAPITPPPPKPSPAADAPQAAQATQHRYS